MGGDWALACAELEFVPRTSPFCSRNRDDEENNQQKTAGKSNRTRKSCVQR
jgi:hypothetical protein